MIDYLRLTIDDLQRHRAGLCEACQKIAVIDQTIEVISRLNSATPPAGVPVVPLPKEIMPLGPLPSPAIAPESVEEAERLSTKMRNKAKAVRAKDKSQRNLPPLRDGQRFKGLRPTKPFADGPIKYQTSYWDPKLKKTLSCGTYTDELDAALAVAEKIGDEAEILRISGMIKQRQNNPDRTSKRQELPTDPGQQIVWECNKCCTRHVQAERPTVCKTCLKDNGFYKVPPRPKKNEE